MGRWIVRRLQLVHLGRDVGVEVHSPGAVDGSDLIGKLLLHSVIAQQSIKKLTEDMMSENDVKKWALEAANLE